MCVCVCVCAGNVCVVAAVIVDRHLHNVANYLVASLAITDLMVAAFVMPFAALQVVSTCWFLAPLVSTWYYSLTAAVTVVVEVL